MGMLNFFSKKAFYITTLSAILVVFHMYSTFVGTMPSVLVRAIHWMLISVIIFTVKFGGKHNRAWVKVVDVFLIAGALATAGYLYFWHDYILMTYGLIDNSQIILGCIAVVLALETSRRVLGLALPIITAVFIGYAFAGPYFSGLLAHEGIDFDRFFSYMFTSSDGIYGLPIQISATIIILFVIFGSFLSVTQAGDFFIKLAYSLAGRVAGGPALTAVTSSALLGTISGSSVANATTVGVFTIPLMKKNGYTPHFAAAVEAVASTGGQILPPVMGATAFLMAQVLGIQYQVVVIAATIPAIFYFITCALMVYFTAKHEGLKRLDKADIPSFWKTLKEGWLYFIPLIILVYKLFTGSSADMSAVYAIFAAIIVGIIKKGVPFNIKTVLLAMTDAARSALGVATACACAGIIMGVMGLTGIGTKLSILIEQMSGGNLLIALLITMVVSIILGMGLPSTACYLVLAILAAPALINMGLEAIPAHLFIYYFGLISAITPPVALTAYAAAGIAQCSPMKAGFSSMRIALISFLIPYVFVYNPAMLMEGTLMDIILVVVITLIGSLALTASLTGWFLGNYNWVSRAVLFVCSVMTIIPEMTSSLIGIAIFAVTILVNKMFLAKRQGKETLSPT